MESAPLFFLLTHFARATALPKVSMCVASAYFLLMSRAVLGLNLIDLLALIWIDLPV